MTTMVISEAKIQISNLAYFLEYTNVLLLETPLNKNDTTFLAC